MSHTMVYRCPGPHAIHGGKFDYLIVEDGEVEEALSRGWFRTTPEAKAAAEAPPAPEVTREELIAQAEKLGVKIDKRWSDRSIAEAIAKG